MHGQALRLLLVEDDESDRLAMRRTLAKITSRSEILDVTTRRGALAILGDQDFDCAFIDHRLPDGNGLDLIASAKAQGASTPLVMLTGYGDEDLAVDALRNGAVDFLSKSKVTAERVHRALERALDARGTGASRQSPTPTRQRLVRAIEWAPESLIVTDRSGRIVYVNAAFSALSGYRSKEVRGRSPRLLASPDTPRHLYREIWRTVASGEVWRGEMPQRRKDGRRFVAAVKVAPIYTPSGELEGFVASHRDISVEKRLARRMERLANTDGLTGLYNHRHLVTRLEQELSRARRYMRPLCLMIIDLDHFKAVNDRYGHLKGDEVLAGSAQVIREVTRASDLAGRYGGEEFAVVLPETGLERARVLSERLRRRIAARSYPLEGGKRFSVTCSIGVAQLSDPIGGVKSLIEAADAALYGAKAAGRNRVEIASPEGATGVRSQMPPKTSHRAASD